MLRSGLLAGANEVDIASSEVASNQAEVSKLKQKNQELSEQLAASAQTIQDLRAVNSKLHAFVVENG